MSREMAKIRHWDGFSGIQDMSSRLGYHEKLNNSNEIQFLTFGMPSTSKSRIAPIALFDQNDFIKRLRKCSDSRTEHL
ncbi:hypothetical protein PABG_12542 [Paracoccidioides brasiliensis Pb03]|nr:hypothetical protein PABG_12542 [Paracoccidioides brasiliensis Pb03]